MVSRPSQLRVSFPLPPLFPPFMDLAPPTNKYFGRSPPGWGTHVYVLHWITTEVLLHPITEICVMSVDLCVLYDHVSFSGKPLLHSTVLYIWCSHTNLWNSEILRLLSLFPTHTTWRRRPGPDGPETGTPRGGDRASRTRTWGTVDRGTATLTTASVRVHTTRRRGRTYGCSFFSLGVLKHCTLRRVLRRGP